MKKNKAPNMNTPEGMVAFWKRSLYHRKQSRSGDEAVKWAEEQLASWKSKLESK